MTRPAHASNRSYVGYWRDISDEGVGPLYILPNEIAMNVAVYEEIMGEHMIPYFKGRANLSSFQQNGARHHTAEPVLYFLENQSVEVTE